MSTRSLRREHPAREGAKKSAEIFFCRSLCLNRWPPLYFRRSEVRGLGYWLCPLDCMKALSRNHRLGHPWLYTMSFLFRARDPKAGIDIGKDAVASFDLSQTCLLCQSQVA